MSVKVTGLKQAQRAFSDRLKNIQNYAPKAIKDVSFDLLGKSVALAPVDTGDLRGSGKVDFSNGGLNSEVSFNTPYALRQHEELSYNHPQGGQAKYLEEPFNKNKSKYIKHIEDSVRRAVD